MRDGKDRGRTAGVLRGAQHSQTRRPDRRLNSGVVETGVSPVRGGGDASRSIDNSAFKDARAQASVPRPLAYNGSHHQITHKLIPSIDQKKLEGPIAEKLVRELHCHQEREPDPETNLDSVVVAGDGKGKAEPTQDKAAQETRQERNSIFWPGSFLHFGDPGFIFGIV